MSLGRAEDHHRTMGFLQDYGIPPGLWDSSSFMGFFQDYGIPPGLWDSSRTMGFLQDYGIPPGLWDSSRTMGFLQDYGIPPGLWDSSRNLGFLQFILIIPEQTSEIFMECAIWNFITNSSFMKLCFFSRQKYIQNFPLWKSVLAPFSNNCFWGFFSEHGLFLTINTFWCKIQFLSKSLITLFTRTEYTRLKHTV